MDIEAMRTLIAALRLGGKFYFALKSRRKDLIDVETMEGHAFTTVTATTAAAVSTWAGYAPSWGDRDPITCTPSASTMILKAKLAIGSDRAIADYVHVICPPRVGRTILMAELEET